MKALFWLLCAGAPPPDASSPPLVEVRAGLEWHSEDLQVERPGPGRVLPSYDAVALPVALTLRPWAGRPSAPWSNLALEGRWLRTLPQTLPDPGFEVVHEQLQARLGTQFDLGKGAWLGPRIGATWSSTRFRRGEGALEPQTLGLGGGASLRYERVVRFALGAGLGYIASAAGLGPGLSQEDGLAIHAEAELSGRAGPVRVGGRLGLRSQQIGPDGAGASWTRIGLGLRVGWEVDPSDDALRRM